MQELLILSNQYARLPPPPRACSAEKLISLSHTSALSLFLSRFLSLSPSSSLFLSLPLFGGGVSSGPGDPSERLGPSYFFITLVLGPLSLL